ncbi:Plant basic secretory protein [Mycena sanguinolenta]|uniref:Plant basic secretory protein n=1 Tax=Mycena sanguinolenta TaxID=230812 RepID=A0A8H6XBR9_9AGAR|nr:Plant basic secretory protein [Mycena sanguinolenta]
MPPTPPTEWPFPKFNIRVEDLEHRGAVLFFEHIQPLDALRKAVLASFEWLYATPANAPTNVKLIQLVLRPMDGVAYTFGSASEKEIHFSLDHIANSASRARDEIMGVLVHEVVHCYQYNANGTAPGGLVEGVADFVRLHAGLAPPHWRRAPAPKDKWDAGYQTTAYFLDWIEERRGKGAIRALNDTMRDTDYDEKIFVILAGEPVRDLWRRYKKELGVEDGEDEVTEQAKDGDSDGFVLVPSYNPVYI